MPSAVHLVNLQSSSQIVEMEAICLKFSPNFLHSLFTPLFSLKCAPSPSPMLSHVYFGALRWLQYLNQHWGGENHRSVSTFVTSIVDKSTTLATPLCKNASYAPEVHIMYRSNQSFNMPPPLPPGIPRAFDTFAVPGRREFDYQSLPGGGEFDPHALGVGNLDCTLDFM